MADIAYYYPAPYWQSQESAWVKSLLLFFDAVAILLPDYMVGRHHLADPTLTLPLEDEGLLRILEPNQWVDQSRTEQLATIMVDLLTSGAFDNLPEVGYFAELSQSRMGYGADVGLADMLVEELMARGLARPTEDGVSLPLHPTVRTTILVLLAQLARGSASGDSIHPATSNRTAVSDLLQMLSRSPLPSAGHVVALDLEPVSLDLEIVPLPDVLAFRAEHLESHRRYRRELVRFLAELASIPELNDRERAIIDRQEEIADEARAIQREARRAFGKHLASWALGLAGGAWSVTQHDPIGIALSAVGFGPEFVQDQHQASAYSYLFAVRDEFRARQ